VLHADAFDYAPDENEVRASLFEQDPIEWNRLPQFQDVTIRLIVEKGVLRGKAGSLYMQRELAASSFALHSPRARRKHHLFCSQFNAGAWELAEDVGKSSAFTPKSVALKVTSDATELSACEHMLLLLDKRTWTSGADTAHLVDHIHQAMRIGVPIVCVHEGPSVVGPERYDCDFNRMFDDDWTPAHLTRSPTNLYKEIAVSLKSVEWRAPGLAAIAHKLVSSTGPRKPIKFKVPSSYEANIAEPNPWKTAGGGEHVSGAEANELWVPSQSFHPLAECSVSLGRASCQRASCQRSSVGERASGLSSQSPAVGHKGSLAGAALPNRLRSILFPPVRTGDSEEERASNTRLEA